MLGGCGWLKSESTLHENMGWGGGAPTAGSFGEEARN
jgi:hypothetical protein